MDESGIKIFQADNGKTEIQVVIQSDTVWLSQKQMAEKMGTKQSALSRLESGNSNPSLAYLKKVANALGADLHISLT